MSVTAINVVIIGTVVAGANQVGGIITIVMRVVVTGFIMHHRRRRHGTGIMTTIGAKGRHLHRIGVKGLLLGGTKARLLGAGRTG